MIELFTAHAPELMFGSLLIFLLTGFPVAFALAACGLLFGFIGVEIGLLSPSIFQALPLRVFGIIQNDTLLAIPFFTLMGLVLERSGMAEELLDTVGQVFGPIRGGLALAVIFVGALLAATTGVVAASVISMGLISLPIMLRYGYSPAVASGAITASGTLAQIVPPSLVLIVIADQLGRSVGDMYKGAFVPAFILIGLYVLFIVGLAIFKPALVPALPPEARTYREPDGSSGMRSATTPASRSDPTKPASGATTSIEASGASPHSRPHEAVSSGAQSIGSDQLAGSSRRWWFLSASRLSIAVLPTTSTRRTRRRSMPSLRAISPSASPTAARARLASARA